MGDSDDFLSGLGDPDADGDGEDDEERDGENTDVQKGTPDRFGVVLFNVEDKKGAVEVLVELNQPDVKFIQSLEKHTRRSHLQNGLDECKKMLYQQKEEMKDAKKAIYILTWLDDPLGSDKGRDVRKKGCLESVNDCKDNGIRVSVVPLAADHRDRVEPGAGASDSPTDAARRTFWVGRFYEELARKGYMAPPEGGGSDEDVLKEVVERRVWHLEQEVMGLLNPRSIASLMWHVSASPKLQIGMKLYPLTLEAKVKSAVWVDQRNNKRVKAVTQRSSKDTGQLLMEAQIEKFFPYGKAEAVIDDKEMAKVKSLEIETGIHLLGFKPRGALRLEDNLRAPYFAYPDEKGLKGSTLTFTAFWETMLRQDRVAVCTMRQRANVAPRLVALVPGRERRDDEGRVLSPDGLHVVPLPFCDDVRTIPPHPAGSAPPPAEAVEWAGRIMDHFQLDTAKGCRDLQNPQLFRHFRYLEALSLGEVVDDAELAEVEGYIMPNPEDYAAAEVVKMFDEFKAAIHPDFDALAGAAGGGGSGGVKRKREPKPAPVAPGDDLKDLVDSGEIKKLTVPQLKEHCKALGLTVGGNKADLIQRISERCAKP